MLAALLLGQWVWLVAILGLALLITVHEFGHFIAAKSFGMRVEKFYVGFPPAALRRTWGETEYGIGIIPLGGFCKISGMTPEEPVGDGVVDEIIADAEDGKLDRTYTASEMDEALTELQGRIDSAAAEDGDRRRARGRPSGAGCRACSRSTAPGGWLPTGPATPSTTRRRSGSATSPSPPGRS